MKQVFRVGNIWESGANFVIIPTNGVITKNGELVCGKGVALQAKERYSDFPLYAAMQIKKHGVKSLKTYNKTNWYTYGFTHVYYDIAKFVLGCFQTKYHFHMDASLSLIGYSVLKLNRFLETAFQFDNFKVVMAFPGIGLGNLKPEEVALVLRDLDPRVEIWRLPSTVVL